MTHPAYCRAANYANGVARDYANWLVACLTLDRVVRIASPYCARRFCTPRHARRVVLLLCLGPPGTPRSHCGDGDRRVVLLLCLRPPGTPRSHCGDGDRRVVLL